MDTKLGCALVRIPHTTTRTSGSIFTKKYTVISTQVYEVKLIVHSHTYTSFKRYSELREFKHSINSKLVNYSLKFPTKRWPAPSKSSDIEQRRRLLELWVNSVLLIENCRIALMVFLGMEASNAIIFSNSLICEPCKHNRSEQLIMILANRITANPLKKGKALMYFEKDFFETKKKPSSEKFKLLAKHLAHLCGENGIGSKALDILYKLISRAHYLHFESFLASLCSLNVQNLRHMKLDLHILKKYGGDSSQQAFDVLKILQACFSSDSNFAINLLNGSEEAYKLYLNWSNNLSGSYPEIIRNTQSEWVHLDCEESSSQMKIGYRVDKGKLEIIVELIINAELDRIIQAITVPEDRKMWDYRLCNMTTADIKEDSGVSIFEYRSRSGLLSLTFDRKVIKYDSENAEIMFESRKNPKMPKTSQELISTKYCISSNHSTYTSFLCPDDSTPTFSLEFPTCCNVGEPCYTLKYTSTLPLSCLKYMVDEISQETDYLKNAWSRLKAISEGKEIPLTLDPETPNLLMEALRRKTGTDYKRLSFDRYKHDIR